MLWKGLLALFDLDPPKLHPEHEHIAAVSLQLMWFIENTYKIVQYCGVERWLWFVRRPQKLRTNSS
jgi:hypothetical protein